MNRNPATVAWLEDVPAADGYRLAWRGDFGGVEACDQRIAEAPTKSLFVPLLDLVDAINETHSAPNVPDEPDETPPGAYEPVTDDLLKRVHDAMLRKWNLSEDTPQWRDRFAC